MKSKIPFEPGNKSSQAVPEHACSARLHSIENKQADGLRNGGCDAHSIECRENQKNMLRQCDFTFPALYTDAN